MNRIAFSIGEPSGIGPEVVLKSLNSEPLLERCTPVIYAAPEFVLQQAKAFGVDTDLIHVSTDIYDLVKGQINVLDVWNDTSGIPSGKPSPESGLKAFQSLEKAFSDVRLGKMKALITAPIDKKNIQQKGFSFPGHTEYLAAGTDTADYLMLLVSGALRVGVVTGHIPLKSVADALNTADILKKVKVLHESLKNDFGITNPKIALLGLNPHAGDGGLLGEEEQTVIQPAIDQANALGINAFGPFPADGFFGSSRFKDYDGILGMYHDQGLIPFKAASFGTGVNFTAGLPIIRCSPDHGTAYDIAGKGLADERSMHEAIEMALAIVAKRRS
jgi:4-hydroxythreonine-4-phosphate dehydrogenase